MLLAPSIANGDGTDATYNHDALADAEREHFWFTSRARLISWAIRRYFPDASSLLDVGCGSGGVLSELHTTYPHLQLTGGEVLLGALQYARRRLNGVRLLQLDIRELPFAQEFDIVCAFDVLEHLDDDQQVLEQMATAVKPGGGLVVTVPQHPGLWSPVDDFSQHRRRYRRRELVSRVERAGFAVRRVTSFVTFLLPALVLSRRQDRKLETSFDPLKELRVGALTSTVGTAASAAERWTIRAGMSWPVGGSLLLVAEKT